MPFLNPWGLLAALSLPAILLLYFLRQQHQEQIIPSTFLWARALQEMEASRPWQKLRKNLLMLLQLLCALLLSVALARPYSPAAVAGEYIVVLDTSASMQATDIAPSRFDFALDELNRLVDGLAPGGMVTVIEAGSRAQVRVGRSADKGAIRQQITAIKPGNGGAALSDALSLARALTREASDAQIVLLSDQQPDAEDISWVDCGAGGDNAAVMALSTLRTDNGLTVLSPIRNAGAARTITLECYVDGLLADARDVALSQDASLPVYWDGLNANAQTVEVRITGSKDALLADNQAITAIAQQQEIRVLLATAGNRFLEAALSLREGVVLEKTTPGDQMPSHGYDLYVYDGVLPDQFPTDGALMLINPSGMPTGLSGERIALKNGALSPAVGREGESILNGVSPAEVQVAQAEGFVGVSGFTPLMTLGGESVVLTGQWGRSATLIIGFDVRDSDWPLKKDFPIFIQNALQWAVPHAAQGLQNGIAGEPMVLSALPAATQLQVQTPSGNTITLAPPFPPAILEDTQALGLYTVTQTLPEDQVQTRFAVHMPMEESDLKNQGVRVQTQQQVQTMPIHGAAEYAPYLLLAALAIMLIEWGVHARGR